MRGLESRYFCTTHWSLVASAADDSSEALESLCSAYWRPLYWHVRRLGYNEADAQDLTQAFFAHLLEKRVLDRADRRRGRLRTFLLTALRRFLINEWKREQAEKRGGGQRVLSLDFEDAEKGYRLEPSHDVTAEKLFEQRWAIALLEKSLEQLEREYGQSGRRALYDALVPYLTQPGDRAGYARTAKQLEMTPGAVKMAVSRLRKQFGSFVVTEVRRTVVDEGELARELENLFYVFQSQVPIPSAVEGW